jgi:uncharacterized protein
MRKLSVALGIALAVLPATAFAQRDPAYAAARASGQVGEKADGYLAAIGGGARALVDDINIKRKDAYTAEARSQGATVEQVAFVAGCRNIARTEPGEKYQAPGGAWQTRGAGAPQRDSRCP